MKKTAFSLAIAGLISVSTAHAADVAGFKLGAALWAQNPSGNFEYKSLGEFDTDDDLGIDGKNNMFLWAALEHPVPFLPNIKLQFTGLTLDGSDDVTQEFTIEDTTFTVGEHVESDVSLNQTDLILYYELLDNTFNFDLGVNFKLINGQIKVVGDTLGEEKLDFNAPLPMLYAHARFDLPVTGLSVGAEGSYTGFSGNKLTDIKAYIAYQLKLGLGFEAGVRTFNLTIDDISDVSGDFTVSGAYGGVTYEF